MRGEESTDLDCGVAAAVENLPGFDALDGDGRHERSIAALLKISMEEQLGMETESVDGEEESRDVGEFIEEF